MNAEPSMIESAINSCILHLQQTEKVRHCSRLTDAHAALLKQREQPILDPSRADRFSEALARLLSQGTNALNRYEHIFLAYNLGQSHHLLDGDSLFDRNAILESLLAEWRRILALGDGLFIWRGALLSYFRVAVKNSGSRSTQIFLFASLDFLRVSKRVPSWLKIVLAKPELLSDAPTTQLAKQWISGDRGQVEQVAADLEIPANSWFWTDLVGTIVHACCNTTDDNQFAENFPVALDLTSLYPNQTTAILTRVINRYSVQSATPRDDRILGLALETWGSPQLGFDGNKHKWSVASRGATLMVCGWLAEEDLEDFRVFCAGDETVDDRRLAYWLRYKKQISFSKLVLGRTIWNADDRKTKEFLRRKKGRVASLSSIRNALILRIGKWWFIEFSEKGKACCPYREGCGFDLGLSFGQDSFSEGQLRSVAAIEASGGQRLIHRGYWEAEFDSFLASKRIWPDSVVMARKERAAERSDRPESTIEKDADVLQTPVPGVRTRVLSASQRISYEPPAEIDNSEGAVMALLDSLALSPGQARELARATSSLKDNRVVGGRLWIELDDEPSGELQNAMRQRGFRHANGRGFYWAES
jgi:hypothetical protein